MFRGFSLSFFFLIHFTLPCLLLALRQGLSTIVPENFDDMSKRWIDGVKEMPNRLADFVDMIFDMAIAEPARSSVYARL